MNKKIFHTFHGDVFTLHYLPFILRYFIVFILAHLSTSYHEYATDTAKPEQTNTDLNYRKAQHVPAEKEEQTTDHLIYRCILLQQPRETLKRET
jgi:hypothetical protein